MIGVFNNASSFNQDIGDWNTSSLQAWLACSKVHLPLIKISAIGRLSLENMLHVSNASSFNQNIGDWNNLQ